MLLAVFAESGPAEDLFSGSIAVVITEVIAELTCSQCSSRDPPDPQNLEFGAAVIMLQKRAIAKNGLSANIDLRAHGAGARRCAFSTLARNSVMYKCSGQSRDGLSSSASSQSIILEPCSSKV